MNTKQRVRLYQETGYSLDTIAKWDLGKNTSESTGKALEEACKRLGLLEMRKCESAKERVS